MPAAVFIYSILKGTRTAWLANLIIKFMSPGVILGVKVSLLTLNQLAPTTVGARINP